MNIYQIFTRLYAANAKQPVEWGSKQENGCSRFSDFSLKELARIKDLGCTHIWLTGIIEHASECDNPNIVKGRAGSPYAIKDYYNVDPDLGTMHDFELLVKRAHKAGLKLLIDFVPNHVSRVYKGDLGKDDDKTKAFCNQNNFYYLPDQKLVRGDYEEFPAKATGNDCFHAYPTNNDWYETIKLNYGIDYSNGARCFEPIPDTWHKMKDILLFWAEKGIDGFRCDMAEMTPSEFWAWAIPIVKKEHGEELVFVAEVYNPNEYRNYIGAGFDYLYDKVGLYDTLKAIVQGASASLITNAWQAVDDISCHMLNFLENHDEQRIASPYFAGEANKGIPMMCVSALIKPQPFMLYFGQEIGERGMDKEGFSGIDGRTTIFDYWSIDSIKRLRKDKLTSEERELEDMYRKILHLRQDEIFAKGAFFDIQYANYDNERMNTNNLYAFVRAYEGKAALVVVNLHEWDEDAEIVIPQAAFDCLKIKASKRAIKALDLLSGNTYKIAFSPDQPIALHVPAYSGMALEIEN